jgi:hypothetical protein
MKTFLLAISILTSLLLKAQLSSNEPVLKQFTTFSSRQVTEKLFVHTDKEFYLAGEIVWYKIYYIDGSSHRPLDLSKLAYVEILDGNNKPVMQGKNALRQGSGKGSFYLPSSVNSGRYKLRAYTNWMKNFDAGFYFEKQVSIVNPLKPLNLPPSPVARSLDFQFFPEGGNLVNDLENRLGFKLNDQYGNGVDFNGYIINQNNDTMAVFHPLKFGMGSMWFTPVASDTYKAFIVTESGITLTKELPARAQRGYVMRKEEDQQGNVLISVMTNVEDKKNGGEVFLVAHTRQVIKHAERKSFINGKTSFTIDKNALGAGVSQLTIFNKEQQPVCERLVFKTPANSLSLVAGTNASRYSRRENVSVDIATVLTGKPVDANLSLSVYQEDSLTKDPVSDMQCYLLLSSDLKGYIEAPHYYFSKTNADAKTAIDNLMLTQGWRRFTWDQSLTKNPTPYQYVPEFDGHIVGSTVTLNSGQPGRGIKTYLSVPGTKIQFYASVTDNEGKAFFDIRDYYGRNELVVQTEPLADSNYRIDIADPFSEKYSGKAIAALDISQSLHRSLLKQSIAMQTINAYFSDSLRKFNVPLIDTSPFYGKYTKRYLLDDYVRFTTMEEVLREYVPEVGIRKTAGLQKIRIADHTQLKYLDGEPLLLLDGVPVSHKQILSYDPMKVRKLEVVTNRYITGKFVFDGIASFSSYTGSMENFVFDSKTVVVDYEGLQLKREFYSPKYQTPDEKMSRLPDFRNVLIWEPEIKTGQAGKTKLNFYTSDKKGKYIGVIQGIDSEGHAATGTFRFEVSD